jgi:hypothetical protein
LPPDFSALSVRRLLPHNTPGVLKITPGVLKITAGVLKITPGVLMLHGVNAQEMFPCWE